MKHRFIHLALVVAAWVVPTTGFAIVTPPLPDTPFFGWIAVPVIGVAGHALLKKKRHGSERRMQK